MNITRRKPETAPVGFPAGVTIRRSNAGDAERIRRLAELDSRRVPVGAAMLAEVEGELVALVTLAGDRPIADPFRRTAEIVRVLEVAADARLDGRLRRRLRSHVPGLRPLVPAARS